MKTPKFEVTSWSSSQVWFHMSHGRWRCCYFLHIIQSFSSDRVSTLHLCRFPEYRTPASFLRNIYRPGMECRRWFIFRQGDDYMIYVPSDESNSTSVNSTIKSVWNINSPQFTMNVLRIYRRERKLECVLCLIWWSRRGLNERNFILYSFQRLITPFESWWWWSVKHGAAQHFTKS